MCLTAPSATVPEELIARAHASLLFALNTARDEAEPPPTTTAAGTSMGNTAATSSSSAQQQTLEARLIGAVDCTPIIPEILSAIEAAREGRAAALEELAWEHHSQQQQRANALLLAGGGGERGSVGGANGGLLMHNDRLLGRGGNDINNNSINVSPAAAEIKVLETLQSIADHVRGVGGGGGSTPQTSALGGMGGGKSLGGGKKKGGGASPSSSKQQQQQSHNAGANEGAWDVLEEDERRAALLHLQDHAALDAMARESEALRLRFEQRPMRESPRRSDGDPPGEALLPRYVLGYGAVGIGALPLADIIADAQSVLPRAASLSLVGATPSLLHSPKGVNNSPTAAASGAGVGIPPIPLGASGVGASAAAAGTAVGGGGGAVTVTKSNFGAVENVRLQRRLELLRQPEPQLLMDFEVIPVTPTGGGGVSKGLHPM